ncbi:unnamed protein product [Rhodiola kirilowii]
MSNLSKLEFNALDITGNNYLAWILDAEIHLESMDLGDAIKEGNDASDQNKAKAMIFIRRHLHEGLKSEYLTIKDPSILWKELKERYDHQKTVILPKANFDWTHLRLQDYKSVSDYNSAMFRITSQMKLCGEKITDKEMLEKTFSTFHASNMLLQQQYRERGFTKYYELISVLLMAEQTNELLMKNHHSRPTGSTPILEANAIFSNNYGRNQQHGRGGHGGRGGRVNKRGRGRGRSFGSYQNHSTQYPPNFKKKTHYPMKGMNNEGNQKGTGNFKMTESSCFRCGMKGHWDRTCRTPKHFVDLYKASLKGKGVEANFTEQKNDDPMNLAQLDPMIMTHFDVGDFYENVNGEPSQPTNDGNMN